MKHALLQRLRKQFPEVEEFATQRLLGNGSIFFDHGHRRKLSEAEIFACLFVANLWAAQAGGQLKLTARELRIWRKHFK